MKTDPQPEHHWLKQLVGEWTYESTCDMGPDQPGKFGGAETARMLGDLWVVCEGRMEMPGGGSGTSVMTLGYDPLKKRYVGTWAGSMMTHLWVYDGEMDAAGTTLTLAAEGPDFTDPAKTTKYHDVVSFADGVRTLTARFVGPDGQWHEMMKATYTRKS